ncbi:MAG: hypothetical protein PHP37_00790 [Patescibacteria group bacterium]|nr:hypothetical protein [Patescibacteria group bacterium]
MVGVIHPFSFPLTPPSNEKEILCFEFWAFTPNPSAQNPKRKKKFENFLKQVFLSKKKKRNTSANSVYLVTALKEPLPILLPSVATSDIRER